MWEFLGKGFAFAATAGVLAALANQLFSIWRDAGIRKRRARHLALQISSQLDQFVDDTLDFRVTIQDDLSQRHDFGNYSFAPPRIDDLPQDVEAWHALKPELATRAFQLPRQVRWMYRHIAYDAQHQNPPEVAQEYADAAVILARDAHLLSLNLRLAYGLAADFEVKDFLEERDITALLQEDAKAAENRRRGAGLLVEDGAN